MAEYVNPNAQAVLANGNVLFTDTIIEPCPCVRHREGSGIFTLRGGHTYLLMFSGNISGGAATTAVSLAFAIAGEEVGGTRMAAVSTAANDAYNVATFAYIKVPCGCCYTFAVKNIGTVALTVDDANLVIRRED